MRFNLHEVRLSQQSDYSLFDFFYELAMFTRNVLCKRLERKRIVEIHVWIESISARILDMFSLSGYHADTPITIKAEAIHEADSRIH